MKTKLITILALTLFYTSPSHADFGDFLTNFGDNGLVTTDFDGDTTYASHIRATTLSSDGNSLFVAGYYIDPSVATYDFVLAKYDVDTGELITDFGTNGFVITDIEGSSITDRAYAITTSSDGLSLFVAGSSGDTSTTNDFAVAKYSAITGDLDTGFDSDGKLTTDFGGLDTAYAIALSSNDLSLFVAGSSGGNFAIAKYNASNGTLDSGFDGDGKLTTDFGGTDVSYAITLNSIDSSLFVAGSSGGNFAIAKYNASNGTLDSGFDSDGKLTTDFLETDTAYSIALSSNDSSLFVAGSQDGANFAIAKYFASNGTLDSGFDSDGKLTTDFGGNETAYSIALSSDDLSLFVAGYSGDNFAIAKYNASNGTLNSGFDSDGKLTTDFGATDVTYAIALSADDLSLFVAGDSQYSSNYDFAIAKYNAGDGTLDSGFDSDGKLTEDVGSSDDRVYAITSSADGNSLFVAGSSGGNFAIAKYNASNGTLDTNFDGDSLTGNGKITTDFLGTDTAYAITLSADGNSLFVAGYSGGNFAIAKYSASTGLLNTGFDSDGKLTTVFGSGSDAYAITLSADGNFLFVTGYSNNGSDNDFAIAKYRADTGALDTSFDGDSVGNGKITTDFGSSTNDIAYAIALSSDGNSLFVAGSSGGNFAIAKYSASTGALDTSFDGDSLTGNGKITTNIGSGATNDAAYAITLSADGSSIFVAGYSDSDSALAKYSASTGVLDTSFDGDSLTGNGKITTDFGTGADSAYAITLSADGNSLFVVGEAGVTNGNSALAKYSASTGLLDTGFDSDGIIVFSSNPDDAGSDSARGIVATEDYQIYLAGYCTNSFLNGGVNFCLMAIDDSADDDADGYSEGQGDCDDSAANALPGGTEVCDGLDNECDGTADDGLPTLSYYPDADDDGFGSSLDDSAVEACSAEVSGLTNATTDNSDCNDSAANALPGGTEVCDGLDNECDGTIDDGFSTVSYYPDADDDGFGDDGVTAVSACSTEASGLTNATTDNSDCNDSEADINTSATETSAQCGDTIDQDCSGSDLSCTCGDGVVTSPEACDDGDNNSDTTADACRSNCEVASCGDGVVDTGEECDAGETTSTCSSTCETITPTKSKSASGGCSLRAR